MLLAFVIETLLLHIHFHIFVTKANKGSHIAKVKATSRRRHMKHFEEGVMWFRCDILDENANCFEIRIFSFTTYNSSVLWRMFGTSLVTLFNWCCNYLKARVMTQIQNFDASLRQLSKFISFFTWLLNRFLIQLNLVWLILRSPVIEIVVVTGLGGKDLAPCLDSLSL